VIVSVRDRMPCVLEIDPEAGGRPHLPWGPLGPEHHTLEAGLREWVERQTRLSLGYVEQLYTFGDSSRAGATSAAAERVGGARAARNISVAYLALVHADGALASVSDAAWRGWYEHLPWEDWRGGEPKSMRTVRDRLEYWAATGDGDEVRARRRTRIRLAFGENGMPRDEERVLERYELLYEAGLIPEAWYDDALHPSAQAASMPGRPMGTDHRRMLATAIGRLRGKIKYRPVLFELMPQSFTLLALQRTAEALTGAGLHKQNFRRLVYNQQLVEPTGDVEQETGGRPAKLMRFRREVELERPSPGVRMSATRRAGLV